MKNITLSEPPFLSIQGEGQRIGRPTVFIRTYICPLRCAHCFVGNTLVNTPKGRKRIDNLQIGDLIYGFDGEKYIETKILNVFSREVLPENIGKIILGNSTIIVATKNHKFFVKDRGWVELHNLESGDILYELPHRGRSQKGKKIDINNYPRWKKAIVDNNPMKNPEIVRKSTENRKRKISYLEQWYHCMSQVAISAWPLEPVTLHSLVSHLYYGKTLYRSHSLSYQL